MKKMYAVLIRDREWEILQTYYVMLQKIVYCYERKFVSFE